MSSAVKEWESKHARLQFLWNSRTAVGLYMRSNLIEIGRGPEGTYIMSSSNVDKNYKLKRRVDLFSGIALIVGTMIGACVRFPTNSLMSETIASEVSKMLFIWIRGHTMLWQVLDRITVLVSEQISHIIAQIHYQNAHVELPVYGCRIWIEPTRPLKEGVAHLLGLVPKNSYQVLIWRLAKPNSNIIALQVLVYSCLRRDCWSARVPSRTRWRCGQHVVYFPCWVRKWPAIAVKGFLTCQKCVGKLIHHLQHLIFGSGSKKYTHSSPVIAINDHDLFFRRCLSLRGARHHDHLLRRRILLLHGRLRSLPRVHVQGRSRRQHKNLKRSLLKFVLKGEGSGRNHTTFEQQLCSSYYLKLFCASKT